MENLYIFKLGGKILDSDERLDSFLKEFSKIKESKILVHGGGIFADKLADKLGVNYQMIDGRRVTSKEMIDVVTMVYGGLLQKQIVAKLQKYGCEAIGLSGADAGLIKANKRVNKKVDYGFVGDIKSVKSDVLTSFISLGLSPVICPLTLDEINGSILNTNADSVACKLTESLAANFKVSLFYCFDKPGVLLDVNDLNSLIRSIDKSLYENLKDEKKIHSGMLPKLDNCFLAKDSGADRVVISSPEEAIGCALGREFLDTVI